MKINTAYSEHCERFWSSPAVCLHLAVCSWKNHTSLINPELFHTAGDIYSDYCILYLVYVLWLLDVMWPH